MNKALEILDYLEDTIDWIEAKDSRKLDMLDWYYDEDHLFFDSKKGWDCDTAACLAGWAVVRPEVPDIKSDIQEKLKDVSSGEWMMASVASTWSWEAEQEITYALKRRDTSFVFEQLFSGSLQEYRSKEATLDLIRSNIIDLKNAVKEAQNAEA